MTMSGGDGRDSELASLRNRVKELEAENAKLLSQVSSCQCQQMEVKHDVLDSGNLVRRSRRGRKRADKSIPIHLISKRYVALKIMYFGKRFYGFSAEAQMEPSIESEIFKALERTRLLVGDIKESNYSRCGRTDKGVSSTGQVIALFLRSRLKTPSIDSEAHANEKINARPEYDYVRVLNRALPDDIRVLGWSPVPVDFHARFSCSAREYKYFFWRQNLNLSAMDIAGKKFIGEHDFRNFCKMDVANVHCYTRRVTFFDVSPCQNSHEGDQLCTFTMRGDGNRSVKKFQTSQDEETMLSHATCTRKTPLVFNSLGVSGSHNRRTLTAAGSFGYKNVSLSSARINCSGRSGTGFGHLGRVSSVSGGGSGDSGGIGGSGGGGGGDSSGGGNGNKWSFLSWYLALLSDYPVLTKSVTSALLTLIGDLICQLTINKTSSLDKKRTLTFTILGLGLVGPALHFWYLYLSKVVTASGLSGAVLRLLLDQFVFAPVFVGVFLSAVVTLEGKPSNVIPKLKQEWTGAVLANWQLWIPFQFLNFRFVPQNFQVLASNVVALAWNVILSFKAHKEVVPK